MGQVWDFFKIKFKAKLYIFLVVVFYAVLFTVNPMIISQLPSFLICLGFIFLMAIVLLIDLAGNLKDLVLMLFKKKIELPVPIEIANLAANMGVTCKSFKIVTDNFNACVLPTGGVLIGDKTFFRLSKEELLAVFAHEFGHHKKGHHLMKISVFLLLLVTGYGVFQSLPEFMIGYALFAFTSIGMIPLSWYFELEADEMGKKYVGADHMISALEKISSDRDPSEASESHPSISARIRALKTTQ